MRERATGRTAPPPFATMEDGHTRTVAEVERYFNVDAEATALHRFRTADRSLSPPLEYRPWAEADF